MPVLFLLTSFPRLTGGDNNLIHSVIFNLTISKCINVDGLGPDFFPLFIGFMNMVDIVKDNSKNRNSTSSHAEA